MFNCSKHDICSNDQLTYAWYIGLFLLLSLFDLITLIVYVRVLPIILHVDQYIEQNHIKTYLKELSYLCGKYHPQHINHLYKDKYLKNPTCTNIIGHDDNDDVSNYYNVLIHTSHHSLKGVHLRIPKKKKS